MRPGPRPRRWPGSGDDRNGRPRVPAVVDRRPAGEQAIQGLVGPIGTDLLDHHHPAEFRVDRAVDDPQAPFGVDLDDLEALPARGRPPFREIDHAAPRADHRRSGSSSVTVDSIAHDATASIKRSRPIPPLRKARAASRTRRSPSSLGPTIGPGSTYHPMRFRSDALFQSSVDFNFSKICRKSGLGSARAATSIIENKIPDPRCVYHNSRNK